MLGCLETLLVEKAGYTEDVKKRNRGTTGAQIVIAIR